MTLIQGACAQIQACQPRCLSIESSRSCQARGDIWLISPSVPGNVHRVPGTWLLQGRTRESLHMHCLESTPPAFIHRHRSRNNSSRLQELLPYLLAIIQRSRGMQSLVECM